MLPRGRGQRGCLKGEDGSAKVGQLRFEAALVDSSPRHLLLLVCTATYPPPTSLFFLSHFPSAEVKVKTLKPEALKPSCLAPPVARPCHSHPCLLRGPSTVGMGRRGVSGEPSSSWLPGATMPRGLRVGDRGAEGVKE